MHLSFQTNTRLAKSSYCRSSWCWKLSLEVCQLVEVAVIRPLAGRDHLSILNDNITIIIVIAIVIVLNSIIIIVITWWYASPCPEQLQGQIELQASRKILNYRFWSWLYGGDKIMGKNEIFSIRGVAPPAVHPCLDYTLMDYTLMDYSWLDYRHLDYLWRLDYRRLDYFRLQGRSDYKDIWTIAIWTITVWTILDW